MTEEQPAWTRHLPPEDRAAMDIGLAGLAGVDRTVALAAWHSTALMHADPELAAALTGDRDDAVDPIEIEVTAEQRGQYEAAAAERGQSLEAFVIAACDAATAGDSEG